MIIRFSPILLFVCMLQACGGDNSSEKMYSFASESSVLSSSGEEKPKLSISSAGGQSSASSSIAFDDIGFGSASSQIHEFNSSSSLSSSVIDEYVVNASSTTSDEFYSSSSPDQSSSSEELYSSSSPDQSSSSEELYSSSSSDQSSSSEELYSSSSSDQSSSSSEFYASISSSRSSSSSLPSDFPTGVAESLPALRITTENLAPIVSKEIYLNASFMLEVDGEIVEGKTEVRGRGNSTWGWDKKPYRLKLTSSIELLGLPANKHWVLLANYADKTLMRNDIALTFSRNLEMEYTPRARYVEVYINDDYRGVYQLVEHVRIGKDRVNIPELKVTDTSADKISGGYLIEIDYRMNEDFCVHFPGQSFCSGNENMDRKVTFCLDSSYHMSPFCVSNPEDLLKEGWSAQRNYIQNYFNQTEAALFEENFEDPDLGYAAYIDVDSAIDYYIINEFFKNPDGAVASAYLYKKRDGKFFWGPIWDFDLALGNAVEDTFGWHIRTASWFARLFEDPAFETKVKARWKELKNEGKFESIFQYAAARANWLQKAQERNFDLWQIFDRQDWYTYKIIGSYDGEVEHMISWQRERYEWMDAQFSQ